MGVLVTCGPHQWCRGSTRHAAWFWSGSEADVGRVGSRVSCLYCATQLSFSLYLSRGGVLGQAERLGLKTQHRSDNGGYAGIHLCQQSIGFHWKLNHPASWKSLPLIPINFSSRLGSNWTPHSGQCTTLPFQCSAKLKLTSSSWVRWDERHTKNSRFWPGFGPMLAQMGATSAP